MLQIVLQLKLIVISIKKLQLFLQTELVVTQECVQVLKSGGYIKVF